MAGEPLPRGYFIKEPPFGRSVNDMRSWIVKKIEQHSIGLVVIDPLAIATRWKDENDPYETGVIMSNLQEIAVKTGAAVVAVHHSTKTGGEWGKEVRGSGGIFGAVMSLLSLKRKAEGLFDLDLINKINGEQKLLATAGSPDPFMAGDGTARRRGEADDSSADPQIRGGGPLPRPDPRRAGHRSEGRQQ
jgi:hypothetical protein